MPDLHQVFDWQGLIKINDINIRVAELGSLSSRAKMAMKIFVKRVFTMFATNASFLRLTANLQILHSKICNIYHVIVHFVPKKHCFDPKRHILPPRYPQSAYIAFSLPKIQQITTEIFDFLNLTS